MARAKLNALAPLVRSCQCSHFSTSQSLSMTKLRRDMFDWLNTQGEAYRDPPGKMAYLGSNENNSLRVFKHNRHFKANPVLSEELREEIYQRVVAQKLPIRQVSAELSVDIRRIAAVVRLKTIEKQWIQQGKPLASQYSKAIMRLVPSTPYDKDERPRIHESISELAVHPWTSPQIFVPMPETRSYNREDASKAFHPALLPPEQRIDHPELVIQAREYVEGLSQAERKTRQQERDKAAAEATKRREEAARLRNERTLKVVAPKTGKGEVNRWEWHFKDVSGEKGVGHRYGAPHLDRKRGIGKIPTRVE